ncbi:MAG: FtsK/SpoIIIE domain-containing protein [Desulfosporosinus sp.]|nr:FtsK/SpoIIIE domain-containing protein [Desulfosporosinus sp.]
MKQQSPIEEIKESIKFIWVHRKGNDAHAAVQDVIDAIWPTAPKPKIEKKIKLSGEAYRFIIALGAGLGYKEFKGREQLFGDAMGGTCQIEKRGKVITMQASTAEIKKEYPYAFDPSKHKGYLPIHCGWSATGEVVEDLADIINLIIAGHPKAGKSNFLHGLIMNILQNKKAFTRIVVFDFKRLEYSYLKNHVLLVTQNEMAPIVFKTLNDKLDKRLAILEAADCVKIHEYLEKGGEMPFIPVIIDELAEMADEECQTYLNRLLRLGRAAGFLVICATQRPSSTMMKAFGDSKAMFTGTLCFHVRDAINSLMLLDNDRASLIPNNPGRGVFQWDNEVEIQAMYLPVKKARQLLKDIDRVEVMNFVEQPQKRLPPR